MRVICEKSYALEVLVAARRIADYAKEEGAIRDHKVPRSTYDHMGAILADSVLQAGLNYATVVRPRVLNILRSYPDLDTVTSLADLIDECKTREFLRWSHDEKVGRFEAIVLFLKRYGIEHAQDLRAYLLEEQFRDAIQGIHGVGPKTVDYMACLVGVDSIAVDRHVRTFAKRVGVERDDYYFLRRSFCCAADLLTLPRREFDAWLWRRASSNTQVQLGLGV